MPATEVATKVANELAERKQKMVRARVVTVVVIAILVVAIIPVSL